MALIHYVVMLIALTASTGQVIVDISNDIEDYCYPAGVTGDVLHADPGTNITVACSANTSVSQNFLQWDLPQGSDTIDIFDGSPTTATVGGFTSTVTFYNDTLSLIDVTLQFTATSSLDDSVIVCAAGFGVQTGTDSCTLKIKTIPGNLINVNITASNTSVFLQWDPPADDGGDTINYIVTVSPVPAADGTDSAGCVCTGGTCITSLTSCNVTELMFGINYTFTVSANNSVGMSAPSNQLVVEVSGNVPDSVSNITYCIQKIFNSDHQLLLQWTSPAASSTSPPITHYNVTVNNMLRCRNESNFSPSSQIDCRFDLSVADEPMITADIVAVNSVGPSTAGSVAINITLELLSITVINVTSDSVTIQCNTSYESSAYCNVTLSDGRSMFDGINTLITFDSLTPGTTYNFTASLVDDSLPDTCFMVVGNFTTNATTMLSSPSVSISISSVASSTGGAEPSTMPAEGPPVAIIGGVVAAVVVFVAVLIIILIVIFCVCKVKKGSTKVNFGGGRNDRGSSAEPIAMVDRAHQETGYDPATALYAEPDKNPSANIRHEEPAPGVLYAQPDKPSRRNPPTQPHQPDPPPSSQPELATYQDPNTIQREAAPTGDLYALPEKNKPVYSEVNKNKTGIVYAALDLKDNPSATAAADDKPPIDVVYSDVKKL